MAIKTNTADGPLCGFATLLNTLLRCVKFWAIGCSQRMAVARWSCYARFTSISAQNFTPLSAYSCLKGCCGNFLLSARVGHYVRTYHSKQSRSFSHYFRIGTTLFQSQQTCLRRPFSNLDLPFFFVFSSSFPFVQITANHEDEMKPSRNYRGRASAPQFVLRRKIGCTITELFSFGTGW